MSFRAFRDACCLSILVLSRLAAATGPDFQAAVAALQRGDSPAAEVKLRAELKANPGEAEAMSLLGVALDNQKKFAEADRFHRDAMAKAPSSAAIHNNFGNHLLLTGDTKGAQDVFLEAVSIDPADDYANLQLAQVAVKAGRGADALKYLDHLPAQQLDAPNVAVVRLMALDLADRRPEADALFTRLSNATAGDVAISSNLGLTLVQAGQFSQAEIFLTHALAATPTNFNLLYQVGVVASRAEHNERARDVFEKALLQQPQNVDVLYGLAYVYSNLKQPEQAVRLLSQAARLAPQRADVQKLLAVTTWDLHAYEDSVAAWDRYVTLAPNDDTGRRERGFARSNIKQADAGLPDLEWYCARHPDDATGWFELGVAQSQGDPQQGLATLDKAIALRPDFADARSARGALNYQQGKAELALADLEFAAAKLPDSAMVLDNLGQTYLLLDRLTDALPVLRKAAELAPSDAKKQLHLANALNQAGQTAESRVFMNRYRELGGTAAVPARGVMEYLSLTSEQQHAAYRARLEKGLAAHPEDSALQVSYLKLSLGDGQLDAAEATAKKIAALKPGAIQLTDAGRALLAANQYPMAKQLLEQAMAADPAAGLDLDLAIIAFHTDGAPAGLAALERVPAAARGGDYYVARAQMLEASGKPDDAAAAIAMAVKAEPARPDLYWQAASLMAKSRRYTDALSLLDQAAKTLPQEAQIPVIKSVVLELSGRTDEAQKLLGDAQRRWPEVAAVWVAEGMILAAHRHPDEARKALETAVSLGAHSAEAKSAAGSPTTAVDPAKLFLNRPPADW